MSYESRPLMTRQEAHGWWATLVATWGILWFATLTTMLIPGPKAPAFLQSVPWVVISMTAALAAVWVLRITYLAGAHRAHREGEHGREKRDV